MKGREGKKKKIMDTCHRWSSEAAAASRQRGPKPAVGREEGLAALPGPGRVEDGQRGRGAAWPRQDGWQTAEPERSEVFAFVAMAACACMRLLPGLRVPAGSAPTRAARGLPGRPQALPPVACPGALAALGCLAQASQGCGCQPGSAGGCEGGFAIHPLATHAQGLAREVAALSGWALSAAGSGGDAGSCGGAGRV